MFLKAFAEVATTSCQQSAYEAHAGMLDGAVGMQMILWTVSYVGLVVGLHIEKFGSLMSIRIVQKTPTLEIESRSGGFPWFQTR